MVLWYADNAILEAATAAAAAADIASDFFTWHKSHVSHLLLIFRVHGDIQAAAGA